MNQTISEVADEIGTAALFARAVYGGETITSQYREFESVVNQTNDDDRYDDYLATLGWTVLTNVELGGTDHFKAGGLYSNNFAQGLLATGVLDGKQTLTLSLRGTDENDVPDAVLNGSAWTADGQFNHYNDLRPLIEAALAYASDPANGIESIVVTGHSLGGTMVDIFTAIDATEFDSLPGIELTVVSLASAGIEPGLFGGPNGIIQYFSDEADPSIATFENGELVLTAPDYYIGFAHDEDRVTYPERDGNTGTFGDLDDAADGLTPNSVLEGQSHFATLELSLPNIDNQDIDYDDGVLDIDPFNRGFGAEHNAGIYWENIDAFAGSTLLASFNDHVVIFGVSKYQFAPDFSGPSAHDAGARELRGNDDKGDFILGLDGNDDIFGLGKKDLLDGGRGRDRLFGGDGADELAGGLGADQLFGNNGRDLLNGNGGNDVLIGGLGNDTLIGGRNNDVLRGNAGKDALNGGQGIDSLSGSNGKDNLRGNAGNDFLSGGADDDTLNGGKGNDLVRGGSGADLLRGGVDHDTLEGNSGGDKLNGGTGNDILSGGTGTDAFIFNIADWGQDTITDFKDGVEFIDMTGSGATAGTLNVSTSGSDAIVDFGGSDTITLTGQAGNIDASDFIF